MRLLSTQRYSKALKALAVCFSALLQDRYGATALDLVNDDVKFYEASGFGDPICPSDWAALFQLQTCS